MQILLALIVGAVIGLALHFLIPHRDSRGVAVAPMIGAIAAGVAWTSLTWAGLGIDSPWLWLSMLVVPPVVTSPFVLILSRARTAHDARRRAELKIG